MSLSANRIRVEPVVDGGWGLVEVELENGNHALALEVEARLEMVRAAAGARGALEFFPGDPTGGHRLWRLDPGMAPAVLRFGVRPVEAEPGKLYVARLQIAWVDQDGERHVEPEVQITIPVEARPEVYALVGAVHVTRRFLNQSYQSLVNEGRDAQARHQTALPSLHDLDLARAALGEESFAWALGLVELGTRLFRGTTKRQP